MQYIPLLGHPRASILPTYLDSNCDAVSFLPHPHHNHHRKSHAASWIVWIGLCLLAMLSACAFFLSLPHHQRPYHPQRPVWRANSALKAHKFVSTPFEFTPHQELTALTAFITVLSSNALPPVDTSLPIDPQLVLDFDLGRHPEELARLEEDVWSRHPVLLFSRHHSQISRSIKAKLNSLELKPAPTFIDVDLRDDASTLSSILSRITGVNDFPVLFIGGQVLHTESPEQLTEVLEYLHDSGELERIMADAGAVIGGTSKTALRKRMQADLRKPKTRRTMTYEERVFRGLISI